jgi:6-pyruvoyl-tetrahydropterin synthase
MVTRRLHFAAAHRLQREDWSPEKNREVFGMHDVNPTTENLIVAMWNRIVGNLPSNVRLAKLVLWETPRNYVEYAGQ